MEVNSDKSACPVCDKEFSVSQIQSHVDKCLFLNSQNEVNVSMKRTSEDVQTFKTSSKKVKYNKKSEEEPSSSQERYSNVPDRLEFRKPLAELMRPDHLDDFVGQEQIMRDNSLFKSLIEQGNIPSMILWGPPGCGKTTLAHIISERVKADLSGSMRFTRLSAVTAGVNDVKEVVKVARGDMQSLKRRTILFLDEIHRFNKAQQDVFLPHVESGLITLIGATTENPSFSLNSALLSRCRVFVLEKLCAEEVLSILRKAADKIGAVVLERDTSLDNDSNVKYLIDEDTLVWLSEISDGDARIALNSLQMAVESSQNEDVLPIQISLENIQDGIKRSHLLYDRKGEEHYNTISALHKSIRASDDNAAIYWLARMLEGGEDPMFIARRLVRAASEDVGLSDPMALTLAVSAMHGCQMIGMPECDVLLAQVTVYLARTHKSQEVYHALGRAKASIQKQKGPLPSVPLHLRNAPTRLMRELGYGHGYNTRHKEDSDLSYLPKELERTSFFRDD